MLTLAEANKRKRAKMYATALPTTKDAQGTDTLAYLFTYTFVVLRTNREPTDCQYYQRTSMELLNNEV